MLDLFVNTRFIDNHLVKSTDVSTIIRNVRFVDEEPSQELYRYQFLEIVVRVSFARYYKTNSASQLECIEYVFKEFSNLPVYYNSNEFRIKKYQNFSVDKSLKKHLN